MDDKEYMSIFDIAKLILHRNEKLKKVEWIDEIEFQQLMSEKVENGMPFLVGRIGGTELFALQVLEFHRKKLYQTACNQMVQWSGLFPNDIKMMKVFEKGMKEAISMADILHPWQKHYEAYFYNKYAGELKGVIPNNIHTAWAQDYPWTKALQGKKVLVVHPLSETIEKQYKNREYLFENPDTLPEFELKTIKAVQSLGGKCEEKYRNWEDALEGMTEQIGKTDFDIALIGCGAYGFPLAARVKKMGKIAVHMAGDTQMLFGIMGKRWEHNQGAVKRKNEYWVYPEKEERPGGYEKVEDGCYW